MTPAQTHKTTVYADTENLGGSGQDIHRKAELISQAVTGEEWPPTIPEATLIKAYCNSGDSARWEEALRTKLGQPVKQGGLLRPTALEITAPEVQKFTGNPAKSANAMDLTLMLETLSDLLTGKTRFAVIISNDSDYGYLLAELRKLAQENRLETGSDINGLPLLIFTHDEAGISESFREFSGNVKALNHPAQDSRTQAPAETGRQETSHLLPMFSKKEIIKAVACGIGQSHLNRATGNYEFDSHHIHQTIRGKLGDRAAETEEMRYNRKRFGEWFHRNFQQEMLELNIEHSREPARTGKIIYRMNEETRRKIRQS